MLFSLCLHSLNPKMKLGVEILFFVLECWTVNNLLSPQVIIFIIFLVQSMYIRMSRDCCKITTRLIEMFLGLSWTMTWFSTSSIVSSHSFIELKYSCMSFPFPHTSKPSSTLSYGVTVLRGIWRREVEAVASFLWLPSDSRSSLVYLYHFTCNQ